MGWCLLERHVVAHAKERGEEGVADDELLERFDAVALDAALFRADHALDEREMVLPPEVEVHVEVDKRVAAAFERAEARRLELGRLLRDALNPGL